MTDTRQIRVAVTHWNRFPLLKECLEGVLGDQRISEIIISDDCSNDGSWEKIQHWAERNQHEGLKISAYRNDYNVDCYRNKQMAVARSTEWTVLFDSDNLLTTDYVNAIFSVPTWNPNVAYCPEFAKPHFNFQHLAGKTIDRTNVAKFLGDNSFRTMLNAMNYFVYAPEYLRVWDRSAKPNTADSIYQNFRWLSHGNSLHILRGLKYFHRVHQESHYKLNHKKTGTFLNDVLAKLRALK